MTSTSKAIQAFADEIGPAESGPVAIEGNRTRWAVGSASGDGPDPAARLVTAAQGIVEYTPEEMTVTVLAGTAVADLNDALAANNQRCALPDRAGTIGGAVAVGEDPLNVHGKGRVRAAVLQVVYISAEGKAITSGGPTVKNVTGFDLPRLMVGSIGTLGCIAQLTLRTNPAPAQSRWLHAPEADAFALRDALYAPSVILRRAAEVWVLLEGHEVDVDAEMAVANNHGDFTPAPPPPLPRNRWSLTAAQTVDLDSEASIEQTGPYVASVLTGTVFAAKPQPGRSASSEVAELSSRIKQLFDPTGRLNPGRTAIPDAFTEGA